MKNLLLPMLLALAGCAHMADMSANRNAAGQPPDYRAGYRDGCESGYAAAGNPYMRTRKNIDLFLGNPVYKTGWEDGFAYCKGDYESTSRALR